MAYHKSDFIKRLQAAEARHRATKKRVYVFNIYEDFAGPSAMKKEFSKTKYDGCTLILNDIK